MKIYFDILYFTIIWFIIKKIFNILTNNNFGNLQIVNFIDIISLNCLQIVTSLIILSFIFNFITIKAFSFLRVHFGVSSVILHWIHCANSASERWHSKTKFRMSFAISSLSSIASSRNRWIQRRHSCDPSATWSAQWCLDNEWESLTRSTTLQPRQSQTVSVLLWVQSFSLWPGVNR